MLQVQSAKFQRFEEQCVFERLGAIWRYSGRHGCDQSTSGQLETVKISQVAAPEFMFPDSTFSPSAFPLLQEAKAFSILGLQDPHI